MVLHIFMCMRYWDTRKSYYNMSYTISNRLVLACLCSAVYVLERFSCQSFFKNHRIHKLKCWMKIMILPFVASISPSPLSVKYLQPCCDNQNESLWIAESCITQWWWQTSNILAYCIFYVYTIIMVAVKCAAQCGAQHLYTVRNECQLIVRRNSG